MKPETIETERLALNGWIATVHGMGSAPLTKKDFPQESWRIISSLVHHNKHNPLVQHAVKQNPDLIPRGYAILSVLYGAYTGEPNKIGMLKDFVNMLGKDLVEEELAVLAYAKTKSVGSFFPELFKTLEMIHEVYSAEHFPLMVLPPTPYQAYTLFVIHHQDLIGKDMRPEELFGHLSVSDSKFQKFLTLANPKHPKPPQPKGSETLH